MNALLTRRRLGRLGGFASTQLAVQAIGFAAGLLLVREMDRVDYGHYTLALSLASVGAVLADLGLATAVMAIGGRLLGQPRALGALVADAQALQARLALLAAALLLPCGALLLLRQQAPVWLALVLTGLVALTVAFNVRSGIALSIARLRGRIGLQQRLDLGINSAKLAVLAVAAALALDAAVAWAVALAAAAAYFVVLRRYLSSELELTAAPSGEHRAALLRQLRGQAPNAVYYVLSSQIAVWLIGLFGNAERVAEVGALGRLAAVFTVIGAVSAALVQPYFAARQSGAELRAGFAGVNGFFAVLLGLLLLLALWLPGPILWVLGGSYGGLDEELVWMVAAATLAAWGGTVYSIGCARGWVMPVGLSIAGGVAAIAATASVVDVSTVVGGFQINAAIGLAGTLTAIGYFDLQLRRHARPRTATT